MSTNCPHCAAARDQGLLAGLFSDDCYECDARFVARSPIYARAAVEEKITAAYRRELERIAGKDESIERVHKRVRAWAEADMSHEPRVCTDDR